MFRKILSGCIVSFILITTTHSVAFAKDNHQEVLKFSQEAFDIQVSLSEKERSKEEIKQMLSPYFTDNFSKKFLEENLIKTEEGYQTLGSDFALYYLPFFSYNDKTTVVPFKDQLYIIEKVGKEGPVHYRGDYQGIRLVNDGGWKIADVLWVVPEEIINQALEEKENSRQDNLITMLDKSFTHISNKFSVSWDYTVKTSIINL